MSTKYTTSKVSGLVVILIGALGWLVALYSSPSGFQVDTLIVILTATLLYISLDVMWGTHMSLEDGFAIRTDNFFMQTRISVADIDSVRYQPTYGVGKEASSLYIFANGESEATFTMTNLWFGEATLRSFLIDLKRTNPKIHFDTEAMALMGRHDVTKKSI